MRSTPSRRRFASGRYSTNGTRTWCNRSCWKDPKKRAKWRARRSTKCVPRSASRTDEQRVSDQALTRRPRRRRVIDCARCASNEATTRDELYAIVSGEAVTQLPTDLYIPPDALEVFLETFEGPLDLLLYLIRRENLDILDIKVAEITAPVHAVHRVDDRAAARTRGRIPRDGRAARRDQVAHVVAASELRSRRRRRSARATDPPAAGIRTLQGRGRAARQGAAARARRLSCLCRTTRTDASAGRARRSTCAKC